MSNSTSTSPGTSTSTSSNAAPAAQVFCDTPLWDNSVSWLTLQPDMTPCLQFAIVRLIPPFLFLIMMPAKLTQYHRDRKTQRLAETNTKLKLHPYSKMTIAKLTISSLLALLALGDLIQWLVILGMQIQVPPVSQFLVPALEMATLVGVTIVIGYERRHGYVATGVLWIYWLFELICYILVGYSAVLNYIRLYVSPQYSATSTASYNTTTTTTTTTTSSPEAEPPAQFSLSAQQSVSLRWTVYMSVLVIAIIQLAGSLTMFLLTCFADHPVDKEEVLRDDPLAQEFGNHYTPELDAGFANRLVYNWMYKIVKHGAHRALIPEDVCTLHPADRSTNNTPRFERVHYAKVAAWRIKEEARIKAESQKRKKQGAGQLKQSDAEAYENPSFTNINGKSSDSSVEIISRKAEDGSLHPKSNGRENGNGIAYENNDLNGNQATKANGEQNAQETKDKKAKKSKSEFEKDETKYPSVMSSLIRVYWKELGLSYCYKLIYDVVSFANIGLVSLFITFASDPLRVEYAWQGAIYAVALTLCQVIMSFTMQDTYNIGLRCGARMRTVLTTALYRKALSISNATRTKESLGELVNLMAVDAQTLQDFIGFSWAFWSSPITIVVACVLIWYQMGPAMFVGLGVMLLFFLPANAAVAMKQRNLREEQMRYKDRRIQLENELLVGIRLVKLYAWELPLLKRVTESRNRELSLIRSGLLLGIVQDVVFNFAPYLITLLTFLTFIETSGEELTAQRAFVTLLLFNIIRIPLGILPLVVQMSITASVSMKRIGRFLAQPDIGSDNVTRKPNPVEPVTIDDATFGWAMPRSPENAVLKNVTLHVQRGELLAVVGRVGAGKSTLVSAILGETELHSGNVNVSGSVAYVAQQSWIQNATLRDNVLFGAAYDEARYKRVVAACALEADLAMLPGGDLTEIGEKGINISGGQKQRVALARAVYADADIYLLDDPLSAVDVHVGKHIFEKLVGPQGLLQNKTRVLVTHGLHWLRHCDRVAVLDADTQRLVQIGTYDELMNASDSFLLNHLHLESERDRETNANVEEVQEQDQDAEITSSKQRRPSVLVEKKDAPLSAEKEQEAILESAKRIEEAKKLVQDETLETGSVKFRVYLNYFRAQPLAVFLSYALIQAAAFCLFVIGDWWVAGWTNDPRLNANTCPASSTASSTSPSPVALSSTTVYYNSTSTTTPICYSEELQSSVRSYYMGVYGAIGAAAVCVLIVSSTLMALGSVRASRVLHSAMLKRVLHAPSSFFDTTPTGRIVNRFSKDMEMVDNLLPFSFRGWLQTLYRVIFAIVGACIGTPLVLTAVVPAVVAFHFVQRYFISTSRQLKRLESTTKSPIFTHFSESLQGAPTIRAFGACERFIAESEIRTDRNNIYVILGLFGYRWIGILLDAISALFVAAATAFCVVSAVVLSTTGGLVGLTLIYSLNIAMTLNWVVRMNSEIETNIVSVERIREYTQLEQEAEWERSDSDLQHDGVHLTPEWPAQGAIEFDQYSTRYRENLDLVLRDLCVKIKPGEKVGIVGRTGAGKSSITLALFRMIERAGGCIMIDGIDVARLGLHQLRGKLTILPQDPVIFGGTLRSNLDPFELYTDEQVWRALEQAGLASQFAQGKGLQHECSEGGSNLSVGQRQLLCLARALLRKTKVLVLDEATAAVDVRTDEQIQQTIRTAFADCTVLTIAHRINTVMDYDRILVLDRGTIKEFDSPAALIAKPDSVFGEMVRQAESVH